MRKKREMLSEQNLDVDAGFGTRRVIQSRQLRESVNGANEVKILQEFVGWCKEYLHLRKVPKISLTTTNTNTKERPYTGVYDFGNQHITIYVGNRNTVDICRSIAHELVHVRQFELGMVSPEKSYPGSAIEILADAVAGKMVKLYGKEHREIYQ